MKKNNLILFLIGLVVLIGLVFYFNGNRQEGNNLTNTPEVVDQETGQVENLLTPDSVGLTVSPDGKTVGYQGRTGFTVLEILQAVTDVEVETTGFGPMVKSIAGVGQTDKEFWLYSIDGQAGTVGAHEQQTEAGQQIEWRLSGS